MDVSFSQSYPFPAQKTSPILLFSPYSQHPFPEKVRGPLSNSAMTPTFLPNSSLYMSHPEFSCKRINPVLLDLNEMEGENLRFSPSISFKSSKTKPLLCYPTCNTSLPTWERASMRRCASAACSRGKVSEMASLRAPSAMR